MGIKRLFLVSNSKYSILKSDEPVKGAFANIIDKNETTVIIEEDRIKGLKFQKKEEDFRLVTFDMELPFSMTGFISKISTALAEKKIPLFVISAFTTDHILIKEKYLQDAERVLINLGFKKTR